MKKLFILYTFVSLCFSFYGQDYWEHVFTTDTSSVQSLKLVTDDALFRKLNKELVFSNSNTSDLVWEKIPIPEGKELRAFEVTHDNELYIGCYNGGVYEYNFGEWELIGLENQGVADFEVNSNNNLFAVSNDLYVWDGVTFQFVAYGYKYPLKNTYGGLFASTGSQSNVIRSLDNGVTWDTILTAGGGEHIADFVSTSPDSIFMGTTNWVGYDGGVYLSTDGGDNLSHFGLSQHFIECLSIDNFNQVYAGNSGHYITGQGGLYRFNYGTEIWDTIHYFPYITSIVFNTENHIYTSYTTSGMADWGGVIHSEDNGETWVLDTAGIGNTMVHELQIDNNGYLYALTGYTTKKLYRTTLPVNLLEILQPVYRALHCFPNPAEKNISITFKASLQNANQLFLTISNTTGQTFINRKLTNSEMENGHIVLDISNLRTGFYVCRTTGNYYYSVDKFLKQ